jgi:predicted MFS family arabinose efflux permease
MANLFARAADVAGFGSVGQVMRHRDFRVYLMGHIPNVIGVWVVRVAIAWLAWELTKSEAWVGAMVAADAMPVLLIGPMAGVLADRFDRRKIAMLVQAVLAVISVVLAVLTYLDAIDAVILLVLAFARGITFSFWQPVRLAMMPNLVPRAEMPVAIALNSSTFNAAYFVGPAVGSALMKFGGPELAFAVNTVAASAMVWALAVISTPAPPPRTGRSFVSDMMAGIRYGLGHPGIAQMLGLLIVVGLMVRPLTELLPPVAETVFGLGVDGFSALVSSVGLGAMCGAIWMLRRGNAGNVTSVALSAGLVGGTAAFLVAAVAWFPLALLCLAVLGFSMTSGGIATQQAVQLAVPDEVRGRVLSMFGMIFRAAPATGAFAMGWIAEAVGITWPVAVGAALGLSIYGYAFTRRARLRAALEMPEDLRTRTGGPGEAPAVSAIGTAPETPATGRSAE